MNYRVKMEFSPSLDVIHFSKLIAGLCSLAERRVIQFEASIVPDGGDGLRCRFEVILNDLEAAHRVVVDLSDQNDRFDADALSACDLYFKRSYWPPAVETIPEQYRCRVRPFGLNMPCVTPRSLRFCAGSLLSAAIGSVRRSPVKAIRAAIRGLREMRQCLALCSRHELEQPPDVPLEPSIVFQTRVWPPEATSEDLHRVNEERARLIRRMRQEFGGRFRGGLVPWPYAKATYPDLVLTENYRPADYMRVRVCPIRVSSRPDSRIPRHSPSGRAG